MDALRQERTPLRKAFTKAANALDETVKATSSNADMLIALLTQLEDKGARLVVLDKKVLGLMVAEKHSQQDYDKEFETCEGYADRLTFFQVMIKRMVSRMDKERMSSSSNGGDIQAKRKFRLPEIELKKFSGNLIEWLGFWSQFKKIHEDPDIDPEDKYQYLIQATAVNSRARELVESFPPTSENYLKAVEHLRSRFGREDTLIEVYVRELLRLVLNNALNPKENKRLSVLYDKVETRLRALESLGVTSDKYAAMLFPLVESCLPEDVLRAWERNRGYHTNEEVDFGGSSQASQNKLKALMVFLRHEVEGDERIAMARSGFGLYSDRKRSANKPPAEETSTDIPTATGLFIGNNISQGTDKIKPVCIFCERNHESLYCRQVCKISLDEKRKLLSQHKCCFLCFKKGHIANKCKSKICCASCGKRHSVIICPDLPSHRSTVRQEEEAPSPKQLHDSNLANHTFAPEVVLQTLVVRLRGTGKKTCLIRALVDTGSQRSYISEQTARDMGYTCLSKEQVTHCLFGGVETARQDHKRYRAYLTSVDNKYLCNFEVWNQPRICGEVSKLPSGPWNEELRRRGVVLTDCYDSNARACDSEIRLLIGADVAGKLLTGRVQALQSGPVAVETRLGWTLMGKLPIPCNPVDGALLVTSLFVSDAKVRDLWELDCLGIKDPAETKSTAEHQEDVMRQFQDNVQKTEDGRYEVALPWVDGHPPLPSNRYLARKRLVSTVKGLRHKGQLQAYYSVLGEWETEEVIESVPIEQLELYGHYLPHRAVIRESSKTTKIRPVFDASAKERNSPSLNDCLEKGPNLIEVVPAVLNRFRKGQLGIVSDITKAFLQITIREEDRNYLRFLWCDNEDETTEITFRHRRVVFGLTSSPFLLGATLTYHLERVPESLRPTADKLKDSFYVDNCVTSVDSEEDLLRFIAEAREVMLLGKFELRGWHSNSSSRVTVESNLLTEQEREVSVLGLIWDTQADLLSCDLRGVESLDASALGNVTKRTLLSIAHRVFDPIGFTCPVMLYPKLLLQKAWNLKTSWDEKLPCEIVEPFIKWFENLLLLKTVKIPRRLMAFSDRFEPERSSLHVFCDASKVAYATCVYLRSEGKRGEVCVQLVQARARVAPLRSISIPRLELLACCIGARLANTVKADLRCPDIPTRFWTDAADTLYWIKKENQWGTFVWNRVKEIRSLSDPNSWFFVSGDENPADLPSRGCSAKQLATSVWWNGPQWLKDGEERWPNQEILPNRETIAAERKKITISNISHDAAPAWYCTRFSSFLKTVRTIAWLYRFCNNASKPKASRDLGELSLAEQEHAECTLLRMVQRESFHGGKNDERLRSLKLLQCENGLLRVETRIVMREDDMNFRYPNLLPAEHQVVKLLIRWKHQQLSHAGIQLLMAELRERYWIIHSRRTIRKEIRRCVRCRRFDSKRLEVCVAPLPADRVRDASAFEVTGVDLAGPCFMKGGEKAWIVLYTCAFVRAVHLELVTSLSTDDFLQTLRRFIARRGRPVVMYSDNGTNFVGADNALKRINWSEVREYATARRIEWKFNPPSAAWWGGWWERLIGLLKKMLGRVLGKACLSYEELNTTLCDCEGLLNSRPLTYVSEDGSDLVPLTPAMFLQDIKESGVPDLDLLDSGHLSKRYRYRQKIKLDLRKRFRKEYLGQLGWPKQGKSAEHSLKVGEIVLIDNENTKRIDWPLGVVVEIFPGLDGQVRVAKVKTKTGTLLRPTQKLHPMEIRSEHERQEVKRTKTTPETRKEAFTPAKRMQKEAVTTRSGRIVKPPDRFSV